MDNVPEAGFDLSFHKVEQLDPSLTWGSGRQGPRGLAVSGQCGAHLLPSRWFTTFVWGSYCFSTSRVFSVRLFVSAPTSPFLL